MKIIITESQLLKMGKFFHVNEEYTPTETDYLHWKIPNKFINELGIKLWDKHNDSAYIEEIHFDTKRVYISLFVSQGESYFEAPNIPSTFKDSYLIRIDDLPQNVKNIITRRLKESWGKYI